MAKIAPCTRHTERCENKKGIVVDCHDCAYVDKRNALIPEAIRLTEQELNIQSYEMLSSETATRWNASKTFHRYMDELWRACK